MIDLQQRLPGVVGVYTASRSAVINGLRIRAAAGMTIPTPVGLNRLPITRGEMEMESEPTNNGRVDSVTLKFDTTAEPLTLNDKVFVVDLADESRWLIGGQELPYPAVKWTGKVGQPGTSAATTIEVRLKCECAAVRLL